MRREEIRKYQLAQLELLKYTTSICERNNIKYYLVWGSLLGAIRENGFIPWDADIDIAMYRKDYDKFCSYLIENVDEYVFLSSYLTDKNHSSPHAVVKLKGTHIILPKGHNIMYKEKYDGIYIDIFPIDNVPEDINLQKKQNRKILRIQQIIKYKLAATYGGETGILKRCIKKVVSFVLKPISLSRLNNKMDSIYREYDQVETKYVAMLTDPMFYPKQTFKREVFGEGKNVSFEGNYFMAPEHPEEFLSLAYGDYLVKPPEDKRFGYLDRMIDHIDYGKYGEDLKIC